MMRQFQVIKPEPWNWSEAGYMHRFHRGDCIKMDVPDDIFSTWLAMGWVKLLKE